LVAAPDPEQALPKRNAAELADALRSRAHFLTGERWEMPATREMMREAADLLAECRSLREQLMELFVQGFQGKDPLLREFYYKDDGDDGIKCMDCDALTGTPHKHLHCRVARFESLLWLSGSRPGGAT
jgi:hypothetical protein